MQPPSVAMAWVLLLIASAREVMQKLPSICPFVYTLSSESTDCWPWPSHVSRSWPQLAGDWRLRLRVMLMQLVRPRWRSAFSSFWLWLWLWIYHMIWDTVAQVKWVLVVLTTDLIFCDALYYKCWNVVGVLCAWDIYVADCISKENNAIGFFHPSVHFFPLCLLNRLTVDLALLHSSRSWP